MAGSVDQGVLTTVCRTVGRFAIERARPGDDAAIRSLLRSQSLGGAVRLALTREPDARLAAGVEGRPHHTFVVRDRSTGRIQGMFARAVQSVWINGQIEKVGYLNLLRRAPDQQVTRQLLTAAFQALDSTRQHNEAPVDLTAIVADNLAARRLLEKGLPHLPTYRFLCGYQTLWAPTRVYSPGRFEVRPANKSDIPSIVACLGRNGQRHQFGPAWDEHLLTCPVRCRGLQVEDFLIVQAGGHTVACAAVWDQSAFKQVVVKGYDGVLGRSRPWLNLALAITGRPRLPNPGGEFACAYLSHLAVDGDDPHIATSLLSAASDYARARGIDYLVVGLPDGHPLLGAASRVLRGRSYESRLYLVHRENGKQWIEQFDDRRFSFPEVALL